MPAPTICSIPTPRNYALALLPCSPRFGSNRQRPYHQYVSVPDERVTYLVNNKLILPFLRPIAIDVTSDQVKLQGPECHWKGTAPNCFAQCDGSNGWLECDRSRSGDGRGCYIGFKKLCCKDSCPAAVITGELPKLWQMLPLSLSLFLCHLVLPDTKCKHPSSTANDDNTRCDR